MTPSARPGPAVEERPASPLDDPRFVAVISVLAGLVGVAGMVGFGVSAFAVFAVGAGHVALFRARGRAAAQTLAIIGLVLGYGVALWSLVNVVGVFVPAALSQQ